MISVEYIQGFIVGIVLATALALHYRRKHKIDTFGEGKFKKGSKRARQAGRAGANARWKKHYANQKKTNE